MKKMKHLLADVTIHKIQAIWNENDNAEARQSKNYCHLFICENQCETFSIQSNSITHK